MPRVVLEEVPEAPKELEEYVAALFQASGYFVEKNVIERSQINVLELDVVATSYDEGIPASLLGEAKSGDWGLSDLFKLLGWKVHLDIGEAILFIPGDFDEGQENTIKEKFAEHGVRVLPLGDFSNAAERFQAAGLGTPIDEIAIELWRLSYWVERHLLLDLQRAAKANTQNAGPRCVKEYLELVNNEIVFEPSVRKRAIELYSAYHEHPKLSLAVAKEIEGSEFDPGIDEGSSELIREALLEGKHESLQASFYVEHRARLAIIKALIDRLCVEKEEGDEPERGKGLTVSLLPSSAHDALQNLREKNNFRRYPLLWQVFIWGFGGFYLSDREDQEFDWLSEQSGVPQNEIADALRIYDIVFPLGRNNSWLVTAGNTHCRIMRMIPPALRGVGALQRRQRYGIDNYSELGYEDYTAHDLGRWHNSLIKLLSDN